jgi:acyl-CoA hydrolase
LPDAILEELSDRRGLRVHSGMLSDACVDLFEGGAVDGPMVTAELVSTPRLMAWADGNPNLVMAPASYTHGAAVLAGLERFVALNSTVEIALDGSCNSEVAGGTRISGPGGAPDFAFGASVAPGGRAVLALRSTAGRGSISRIVPVIEPPAPVTIPGYLADIVVTEHGAAEVRGLPLGRRAEALRSIADPAHRPGLDAR